MGLAIILIPGGFEVAEAYGGETIDFYAAFALYVSVLRFFKIHARGLQLIFFSNQIFGWFIFTFMMWLLTLRSTLAFNTLFLSVWLAFICLGAGYLDARNTADGHPNVPLTRAGGAFGIIAAFIAWYNMLAGLLDDGNSFFVIPVVHFPWSEKGRADKRKNSDVTDDTMV